MVRKYQLERPIPDQKPANLQEQLTLEEARSGVGKEIIPYNKLGDVPRLEANYGPGEWVKMTNVPKNLNGDVTVQVTSFHNKTTGQDKEFKFKRYIVENPLDGR